MKRKAGVVIISFLLAGVSSTAQAQTWFDHYDAGLTAADNGEWSTVRDRMTKAIALAPQENNKARAYGTIFKNYHPYYYRGAANYHLGNYDEAIADLTKAQGPGPVRLGTVESLMEQVRTAQTRATRVPEPQPPQPQPVIERRPDPVEPRPDPPRPVIDPGLRKRAQDAVEEANEQLAGARSRDAAATSEYKSALALLNQADLRLAAAKSNEDLNFVIAEARNASRTAQSAVGVVVRPPVDRRTRGDEAAQIATAESERKLKLALETYFQGEFEEAVRLFEALAVEMPRNGWIWAFLGASQYSRYAFEADEQYRAQAIDAFKKAKEYGKWGSDGLPSKYFSRRIRQAYKENAG